MAWYKTLSSSMIFVGLLAFHMQGTTSAQQDLSQVDFNTFIQKQLSIFSEECIGNIIINVDGDNLRDWCTQFKYNMQFLESTACDQNKLQELHQNVCNHNSARGTITTPTERTMGISLTSLTQNATHSPGFTIVPNTVTDSELSNTPNSVQNTLQPNVMATSTARHGDTVTTKNPQNLLYEIILKYKNETSRFNECQASTLAKLTSANDVSKVCASIKQFKEILTSVSRQSTTFS